jgi:hypothetical protein
MASNLNTSKPWSEMDLALNALDRGYSIELIAGYRLPDDHERLRELGSELIAV